MYRVEVTRKKKLIYLNHFKTLESAMRIFKMFKSSSSKDIQEVTLIIMEILDEDNG